MINDAKGRIKFCFVAAIINSFTLIFPNLRGFELYFFVFLGALLNAIAIFFILSGVKPWRGESEHLEAVVYAKRGILLLAGFITVAVIVVSLTWSIGRQAIPFILFSYAFVFLLPMKIFDLSVARRMREMDADNKYK